MTAHPLTTHPSASAKDSLLRRAIRLDATGVGLFGLAGALFAGPFASLTGLAKSHVYVLAVAFVFYGVLGNWLATRAAIRPIGTGLSIFNFLGAAAQIGIVPAGVLSLTGAGKTVAVLFGLYALFFGVLQLMGVRRMG